MSKPDEPGAARAFPLTPSDPWWLKFFVQVGFPTALAITLVAALLGWMPSPMMDTLKNLEYASWQQIMLMRQLCYNTTPKENTLRCEPWKPVEQK